MNKVRTPECACPECRAPLDAATGQTGKPYPDPGDLTICCYCAASLEFDENLMLKPMSNATWASLDEETKELFRQAKQRVRDGSWRKP